MSECGPKPPAPPFLPRQIGGQVPKSKKQPQVSKPVAVIVVLALAAVVIALVVGLVKLMGPGYTRYEGQCLPNDAGETDRDYDEMFVDCSDADAHWEITKVYTSEPRNADWSSKTEARRWLERTCDVNDPNGPSRRAYVFRLNDEKGFLACATAIE
jgi:hypothetical protein